MPSLVNLQTRTVAQRAVDSLYTWVAKSCVELDEAPDTYEELRGVLRGQGAHMGPSGKQSERFIPETWGLFRSFALERMPSYLESRHRELGPKLRADALLDVDELFPLDYEGFHRELDRVLHIWKGAIHYAEHATKHKYASMFRELREL